MSYSDVDIKFYEDNENFDGDIKIEGGDLKLTSSIETTKQEIMNRCKTNNPDWYRHFELGADLEDLRGMTQSEDTANLGTSKILDALIHDNKFSAEDLRLEPVPTGMDEITFFIFVKKDKQEPLVIDYTIKL